METLPNNLTEYSAIAIIVIFLIKEMFVYLRAKKNNNNNGKLNLPDDFVSRIARMEEKLDNHVTHFCKDLSDTNSEVKEIKKDIFEIKVELVRISALLKDK